MSDKSYVTMEQHRCPICGTDFDTGALLLDRRLKERFDKHTVTGMNLCPDCSVKDQDGYVALIACDATRSGKLPDGNVKFSEAYRTGMIAHLKREAAARLFNLDITEEKFVFCDADVIRMLQEMSTEGMRDDVI